MSVEQSLWSVANRFHFSATELMGMKITDLAFWMDGHIKINKEEEGMYNK